jgi:hypothetical protein
MTRKTLCAPLLLLLSLPLLAQEPAPTFRINAHLVNVFVNVTDHNGAIVCAPKTR